MSSRKYFNLLFLLAGVALHTISAQEPFNKQADQWRADRRIIDLHQHINCTPEQLGQAIRVMDASGVGLGVNLSGGTVTRKENAPSDFEKNKAAADQLYPGRFIQYMNLDYSRWNEPDFSSDAAKQIEEGHRLGAAGLKEYKRLGLYLRDKDGQLIKIDDPKLDAVWKRCGELGMPVSIHVADPKAFWLPYDDQNERWKELKDHRNWWFGEESVYPKREVLLASLNRVIERHPKTTFVCVHFANNAEDLDWVEQSLDRFPNMYADLAARVPEIGRHDPAKVRRLFEKHQDRILFATDFQVLAKMMILGSSGSGPLPTEADAIEFYRKHWRWMETNDRNFEHMTPIQGDWTISGIGLRAEILRKIYFDNARRLLVRSLPTPTLKSSYVPSDFDLNGKIDHPSWQKASPAYVEAGSLDGKIRSDMATRVRCLWSDNNLYLAYECPYTETTTFEPSNLSKERLGLWDRDVVEAFIGPDPQKPDHYSEYEVAPNGENLDLIIAGPKKDFDWSSGWKTAVTVDKGSKVWKAEMKIPLKTITSSKPSKGSQWRINLYRIDRANNAFLAWNPALRGTFHTPSRFGVLEFAQ